MNLNKGSDKLLFVGLCSDLRSSVSEKSMKWECTKFDPRVERRNADTGQKNKKKQQLKLFILHI